MKIQTVLLRLVLTGIVAAANLASAQQPPRGPQSLIERIKRDDANGDGKITREEFKGPSALFQRIDANNDEVLTADELQKFAAAGGDPAAKGKAPGRGPQAAPLPEGSQAHRDIAYVPDGHEWQKLDLFIPAGVKNPPLVVWIHGGGWQNGSKDGNPARSLLTEGYAVAGVNYRLSSHAIFPAQIEDCKAAIRWLRANAKKYGYDSDRIGVWGSSAGGHLVAMLGVTGDAKEFDTGGNLQVSSRVQAVADFYGPTELFTIQKQSKPGGRINHDAADSPESKLIGATVPENQAKADKASPITYVTKGDAPILIVHGDADPLVPLAQSEEFLRKLKSAGVDAELYVVKDGGHGGFKDPEVDQRVRKLFARVLKAGK